MTSSKEREAPSMHTPGPWRINKRGEIVSDAAIENGVNGSSDVAYYGGHLIAESVSACNRRLIATAPELLAALDGLMTLEARGRIMPIGREWDAARAAIGKVLGEQQ